MTTLTPLPPAAQRTDGVFCPTLAVVGRRVDWLTLAAVLEVESARLDRWRYASVAEVGEGALDVSSRGVVRVALGGWGEGLSWVDLAVVPLRGDRWKFSNADVHGIVDLHPIAGCHLEVHFSGSFLATNTVAAARAYLRAIAATLGQLVEVRVRRLDLAVDVAGWQIEGSDRERWVKPGRAGLASFVDLPDENATVRTYGAQRVTGFTVAPGGAVLCRNYDKHFELKTRSPDKLQGEEFVWRSNGWNGEAPVARVEFQLRSEALRSFGVVGPDKLEAALDPIWQYLVKHWCRMVVPGTATRLGRCDVDPRWQLLERVQFTHESHPAARRYLRGGASLQQALGGLLSYLSHHDGAEGAQLAILPANASPGEAAAALELTLASWAGAAAREMASALVALHGEAGALEWFNGRASFALARAATVGGGAVPPPEAESHAPKRRKGPSVQLWAA